MHFTREQIDEAKAVNLYDFLINNHEDEFKKEYGSIRPWFDKSISIRDDFCGYYDFATGEGNDNIDFLTTYMGYSFEDAVSALLSGEGTAYRVVPRNTEHKNEPELPKEIILPPKCEGFPRQVYAYLTKTRGLPKATVLSLINSGLIYQTDAPRGDTVFHNMVFVNGKKDCYEVRGTLTYGKRFMKNDFTLKDRFWYFGSGTTVYLAEGAVDAISLYEILNHEPAIYASMRGVSNHQIIDRILRYKEYKLVLAVDNDVAGENLRKAYPKVPHIKPKLKDWNEDFCLLDKEQMQIKSFAQDTKGENNHDKL